MGLTVKPCDSHQGFSALFKANILRICLALSSLGKIVQKSDNKQKVKIIQNSIKYSKYTKLNVWFKIITEILNLSFTWLHLHFASPQFFASQQDLFIHFGRWNISCCFGVYLFIYCLSENHKITCRVGPIIANLDTAYIMEIMP